MGAVLASYAFALSHALQCDPRPLGEELVDHGLRHELGRVRAAVDKLALHVSKLLICIIRYVGTGRCHLR